MSRHRNVRTMNMDDFEDEDDIYGHSLEDDCISPSDTKWIYDRDKNRQTMSEFFSKHDDIEEEGDMDVDHHTPKKHHERRDSENFQLPDLNDEDKARLLSCMEEIRSVVGETVTDRQMVDAIMKHNYDCNMALDEVLNASTTPPVPRTIVIKESTPTPIEKGIGKKLVIETEKTTTLHVDKQEPSVLVVTPTSTKMHVTRGFEVSSPRIQSPMTSGRNTPEIEDLRLPSKNVPKESNRNAKELYAKERGDIKQHIHMVVIGHVDAGKSTLMGHLLFDTGHISQRVMHKHEQESKKMGKQSFMYAWVLDETGEERARGITMDVGSSRFETPNKQVTLLDAPGHKDFIPNMISGANQADVALLVVDATRGEFETGFEQGGQTREHALLVRSLGVSQLCVVVNKLDTVGWSKDRFDEICSKLRSFLKQAGFKDADLNYIPCSGLTGENLVKPPTEPELTAWYTGPTLLSVIDNFKTPERAIDKPFRMSVSDIFKGTGSGFCISGRIESGVACVNDKIMVCPSKEQAQIKNIAIDELSHQTAFAGDQVSITLSGVDISNVSVGYILSDLTHPVPTATRIGARIVVFNIKVPITKGFPVVLHHQSLIEPATIVKLRAHLHKSTGEEIKRNPRCLGNNSCAQVEIELTRSICVERYADFKELGRIMLRVGGVTIAAGLVTDIVK